MVLSDEDFANLDEFMDAIHANRIATPVNSGVNYDDGPNVESNTTLANRSLGIQLIADATVSSKSKARAVKPSDLSSEDSDSDEEINREQHWKQHINKREISETKKENIANGKFMPNSCSHELG